MLHSDKRTQLTVQWCSSAQMTTPFACSFNIFYIYQAFILLFHKALHPSSLFLSLSVHMSLSLSLSLSVVPHPVFLISGISLQFGYVNVIFLQSKVIAVRHIHYPLNSSSDHFHTDAVVPSSYHFRTETVLPPSDLYCIETVTTSGDHHCSETVSPSSDHY